MNLGPGFVEPRALKIVPLSWQLLVLGTLTLASAAGSALLYLHSSRPASQSQVNRRSRQGAKGGSPAPAVRLGLPVRILYACSSRITVAASHDSVCHRGRWLRLLLLPVLSLFSTCASCVTVTVTAVAAAVGRGPRARSTCLPHATVPCVLCSSATAAACLPPALPACCSFVKRGCSQSPYAAPVHAARRAHCS
jgi:hypothetical protein